MEPQIGGQLVVMLPGGSAAAPFGFTANGKQRNRPTVHQAKMLERMGLTPETFGAQGPKKMSETNRAAATERLNFARERGKEVRQQKIAILEAKYGPDWRKTHKLSEITVQEAADSAGQAAGDDPQLRKKAERLKAAAKRPRATAPPQWVDALDSKIAAMAERLERVDATVDEARGLVRRDSLERRDREEKAAAREAARVRAAEEAARAAESAALNEKRAREQAAAQARAAESAALNEKREQAARAKLLPPTGGALF